MIESSALPFKPGFTPHDTLRESYIYPDKNVIIRHFPVMGNACLETHVNEAVSLFDELGSFGIKVAPFSPVATESDSFVFVVDNVEGQAIDADRLSGTNNVAAFDLESQLFKYLEDKIDSGAPFLADIFSLHQYMLIPGGQPVLVDLEPNIVASRQENPENPGIRAMFELNSLLSLLTDVGRLSNGNPDQIDTWRQQAQLLVKKIAEKNGLTIDEEHEQSFVELALINDFETTAGIVDAICLGDN